MKKRETILLDKDLFNSHTRYWRVPILELKGVKPVSLVIDKQEIPTHDYTVGESQILLSNNVNVSSKSAGRLIVEIESSSNLISFWLPIILAIIGLTGTIIQPILHNYQLLYAYKPSEQLNTVKEEISNKEGYIFYQSELNYDLKASKILTKVNLRSEKPHIDEQSIQKWRLIIAAKEYEGTTNLNDQEYEFITEPISFSSVELAYPLDLKTNQEFTKRLSKNNSEVITVLFLIRSDVPREKLALPFKPSSLGESNYKYLAYGHIPIYSAFHMDEIHKPREQ